MADCYSPRESWLLYLSTVCNLHELEDKLELEPANFDTNVLLTQSKIEEYMKDYQKILDEHNRQWRALKGKK